MLNCMIMTLHEVNDRHIMETIKKFNGRSRKRMNSIYKITQVDYLIVDGNQINQYI